MSATLLEQAYIDTNLNVNFALLRMGVGTMEWHITIDYVMVGGWVTDWPCPINYTRVQPGLADASSRLSLNTRSSRALTDPGAEWSVSL